ncbi:sensor histidine kinase [Psychrobacillus sp. BL-248-WT-3]|uniref:sensor histidine kinase n=1 Tax=Psychrobacillus sp. BL-248-WT-3 TaxID=2725306 RepID=UPI00146E41C3|nr:sensor histidine kinase [Psychrobacillus sp. BL-248-WT-3]NME06043.1 HAMP domain-containing histidine kinase [Psychrobacillus sp. BL-248-WT-3]
MVLLLCFTIILLLAFIGFQYKEKRNLTSRIAYMHQKLHSIIQENSGEKVLAHTEHDELRQLLNTINELLDEKQKILATHTRLEESMRKMLSNVSHDLKTPLTVILGYIEMLEIAPSLQEEERQQLVVKLHTKTNEVLKIIHTFFDLAKIEAGDQQYPLSKVNINEICRKNILSFYDLITAKNMHVEIEIPENNLYAFGNEEAIDRVLNNLLSNALTYGADGKNIGLALRYDESYIYMDIWDKGKGIEEYHIDRVFERTYTMDDSRNKHFQGSGLGLTITKRLLEIMGGSIHLSSIPHEKTIFTATLKRITF